MKVAMIVWTATVVLAYAVGGRSVDQALLVGKLVLIGGIAGFVGQKLSDTFHITRAVKARVTSFAKPVR